MEFDSVERATEHGEEVAQTKIHRQDLVLDGLFELGLGFRSALFVFDGDKACLRDRSTTALGISSKMITDLMKAFGEIGQHFRFVEDFVREIYRNTAVCPTLVAAATTIEGITTSVKKGVIQSNPKPVTMLQLQDAFARPGIVLERLSSLAKSLKSLEHDTAVINVVYTFAEKFEGVDTWFHQIAVYVFYMAASPALQMLGELAGLESTLQLNSQLRKAFDDIVRVDQDPVTRSRVLQTVLPTFVDTQQKETVFAIFRTLGLIKTYDKDNVLVKNEIRSFGDATSLEVGFEWKDIERLREGAAIREARFRDMLNGEDNVLLQTTTPTDQEQSCRQCTDLFQMDGDSLDEFFAKTNNVFNDIPATLESSYNNELLDKIIRGAIEGTTYMLNQSELLPTLSLAISSSLSPILSAQLRLANHASLMTLLLKYDLCHHLELQYEYQLLGSGLFSSRLSQALFSSNLSSAERRNGHMRLGIMGLRLESRDSWPPRDSELRLVLMGILSESYQDSFPNKAAQGGSDDLPGDLSFAVRNLTEPEIEACLKQDSLQALDFLRLQYRPVPPLDSILTKPILDKYDRMFRFLLRIKRVAFGTTQMAHVHSHLRGKRSAMINTLIRFRMEACHFVDSLSLYAHTSISSLWTRFSEIIRSLEASLHNKNRVTFEGTDVFTQLHNLHDSMLDQLLFDLQLRKRQEQVMRLIEDILSRILHFTNKIDDYVDQPSANLDADFTVFRDQVTLLITVCHSLGSARAYKLDKGGGDFRRTPFAKQWIDGQREAVGIESLAMMLDMNGFYQKRAALRTS